MNQLSGEECGRLELGELLHNKPQLVRVEAAVVSEDIDDPEVTLGLFICHQLFFAAGQILEGFGDLN